MKRTSSATLIINGNSDACQLRSPLTFVCSRLVYTLDYLRKKTPGDKNHIAALRFFCGEHATGDDKMNNPVSIMNNLLSQLLLSFKFLDVEDVIKLGKFESSDLRALCRRFQHVLRLLPSTAMVFCVIDNLPLFLNDARISDETESLLHWLLRLVHHKNAHKNACVFKLLLTAPGQFNNSELDELADLDSLNVPESVPQSGGFSDMALGTYVHARVEELN